jgi:hypothetical protein
MRGVLLVAFKQCNSPSDVLLRAPLKQQGVLSQSLLSTLCQAFELIVLQQHYSLRCLHKAQSTCSCSSF